MKYSKKIVEQIRADYISRRFRMDDDGKDGQWITVKGRHIHINEEGVPDKGNPNFLKSVSGVKFKNAKGSDFNNQKVGHNAMLDKPEEKKWILGPSESAKIHGIGKAENKNFVSGSKEKYAGQSAVESIRNKYSGSDKPKISNPLSDNSEHKLAYKPEVAGEVKSGKDGSFTSKSDTSKRIDTADGIAEMKKGTRNSFEGNLDENGNLTPERQAIHDDILHSFFKDKVKFDGQPTMTMSGGGPASGKSFVTKNAEEKFGAETVVKIDPDEIKAMFPGYDKMAKDYYEAEQAGDKSKLNAAAYFHEESSALAKRIYQYGLENGVNCVYDGTGDGSVGSVKKKIQAARDAGYKVTGEYVTVDMDEAIKRNQSRYEHGKEKYKEAQKNGGLDKNGNKVDPPRLVPDDHVMSIHQKVTDISTQVAGLFDEFKLVDNNGALGSEKPVIATCKNGGVMKVVEGQSERLTNYLNKGAGEYEILPDGTVKRK